MRFRTYLDEMTIRDGNLRTGLEKGRKYLESLIKKEGKHIGDIEHFEIYKSNIENLIQYGLYDKDFLVTYFNGEMKIFPEIGEVFELNQMLTHQNYTGNHFSAKLLVFLKTRHYLPVIFSEIQSSDNVKNIRKIASVVPVLNVKWFNIETGEIEEFDPKIDENDIKHVKTLDSTPWRIMMEKTEEGYWQNNFGDIKFPLFNTKSNLLEILDYSTDYNMWIKE
jgi:uncharacterized protein (DUF1015 family)